VKKLEDFMRFITRIKGVGKWTAELSIAKVSRVFDIRPYGYLAVKRGAQRTFGIQVRKKLEKLCLA